jgi:Ni/Fe-hydrogenase subunit HybB-like protein
MKETILILALLLSVYLMIISLRRIRSYEERTGRKAGSIKWLTYVSIIIPVVGFILTDKLRKNVG